MNLKSSEIATKEQDEINFNNQFSTTFRAFRESFIYQQLFLRKSLQKKTVKALSKTSHCSHENSDFYVSSSNTELI